MVFIKRTFVTKKNEKQINKKKVHTHNVFRLRAN